VQHGLFAAQAPETGRLEVLLARLRKLVGEERVGSAELLDTHAPETFRVNKYDVSDVAPRYAIHFASNSQEAMSDEAIDLSPKDARFEPGHAHESAVRMLRPPHAVHAEMRGETPSTLYYEGQRLRVQTSSGPWRTDGAWWTHPAWSREEWDVVIDEDPQRCLRLAFDPRARCWYVIGIYD
jgi:protein ImuB